MIIELFVSRKLLHAMHSASGYLTLAARSSAATGSNAPSCLTDRIASFFLPELTCARPIANQVGTDSPFSFSACSKTALARLYLPAAMNIMPMQYGIQ